MSKKCHNSVTEWTDQVIYTSARNGMSNITASAEAFFQNLSNKIYDESTNDS